MTKDEALKLALEALESGVTTQNSRLDWIEYDSELVEQAITAIKEALANEALDKMAENARELGLDYEPPQRTWVGLTDEEQKTIADLASANEWHDFDVMEATETKLKEKNT